jgi:hypothetical protein
MFTFAVRTEIFGMLTKKMSLLAYSSCHRDFICLHLRREQKSLAPAWASTNYISIKQTDDLNFFTYYIPISLYAYELYLHVG